MSPQGSPPSVSSGSSPDSPSLPEHPLAPRPGSDPASPSPASPSPATLSPAILSPAILSKESRTTLRQVVLLAAQRLVQIAAGFLYVALIPRAMGPEVYGQFTTLQAMSLWFSMLSGLGALSMMTRFVPEFIQRGDQAGLRKLCGSLLTLRLGTATAGALLYLTLVPLWFGDLDWLAIALVAATVSLRVASGLPFTLLLGLNLASRWGAAEMLRRLLLFPLTYGGYRLAGLAGACAAALTVEFLLLLLGLWWTRGYIPPPTLSLDRAFLQPYLSFSAVFFAGNLLIMAFQQGGTPLVRLISGHYAEAGYYSIAFGAYLAGSATLWKLISGFGALFSSLQMQGRTQELAAWTNRLLAGLAIAGVLATALLYCCADLAVARLLGDGYRPVARLLWPLSIAGLLAGPTTIARVLSVSFNLGRAAGIGAALQLLLFGVLSWLLVPSQGSMGAALAVLVAGAVYSGYTIWRVRAVLKFDILPWGEAVAWGLALSPLLWLGSFAEPLRLLVFVPVYLAVLLARRLVRLSDARLLVQALRSRQV